MKKYLVFVLMVVAYSDGLAQTYSSLIADATRAYETKNYKLSSELYERAFQTTSVGTPTDYYNASCSFALDGNEPKALLYLEKNFRSNEPISFTWIAADQELAAVRLSVKFKLLVTQYYGADVAKYVTSNEIKYSDLLHLVKSQFEKGTIRLQIRDKIIFDDKNKSGYVSEHSGQPLESVTNSPDKELLFINCEFFLDINWVGPASKTSLSFLSFEKCIFHEKFILDFYNLNYLPQFISCRFDSDFKVVVDHSIAITRAYVTGCTFDKQTYFEIRGQNSGVIHINDNVWSSDTAVVILVAGNMNKISFFGNKLKEKSSVRILSESVDELGFYKNTLGNVILDNTTINTKFNFESSALNGRFLIFNSSFPDSPSSSISDVIVKDRKLGVYDGGVEMEFYTDVASNKPRYFDGNYANDISDPELYKSLIGSYSLFLNVYKTQNNIESYNRCFVALKELQLQRLKFLYKDNPTFESYFRWKLAQLLKFYVRFGTDPARAIVVSLYLILAFGIFFFFFPSDWDTVSKAKLLANFDDFRRKNDKGYVRPFFIFLFGLLISLLNGLALSLNAFVTLGFGNIPTRGIARYFCILEGFVGWFLLSIFSVSLINQVL